MFCEYVVPVSVSVTSIGNLISVMEQCCLFSFVSVCFRSARAYAADHTGDALPGLQSDRGQLRLQEGQHLQSALHRD